MMRVRAAARTHVGNRRHTNEDAFLLDGRVVADALDAGTVSQVDALYPVICAVSDGMGGAPAGEVASRMVLEYLRDSRPFDEPSLVAALEAANIALYAAMDSHPEWRGMGATLGGFLITTDGLLAFGVGDCFAGKSGTRGVRPLLRSFDEVGSSSVVDAALGAAASRVPLRIERATVPGPFGRFVLSTDGIVAGCSINAFRAALLDSSMTPQQVIETLTAGIIDGPAPDNLTCIVIELESA